jgi:hypothetical protein
LKNRDREGGREREREKEREKEINWTSALATLACNKPYLNLSFLLPCGNFMRQSLFLWKSLSETCYLSGSSYIREIISKLIC